MKLKLKEQQVLRIIQESDGGTEILNAYKVMARKTIQRVNSLYGSLRNMTVGEIVSKEFDPDTYENELRALDDANESMRHKISLYVEKHSPDDELDLLDDLAHDINMSVYRKIQTLQDLLSSMVTVHDMYVDVHDHFGDMGPIDV